jgi:hypothetical protein
MTYSTPASQLTQSSQITTMGKKLTFLALKWFLNEILQKKFKKQKSLSLLSKVKSPSSDHYSIRFSSQLKINLKIAHFGRTTG